MQTPLTKKMGQVFLFIHSIPGGINVFSHSMWLSYDNNHPGHIKGSRVGIKRLTGYTMALMSVFIVGDFFFLPPSLEELRN